MTGHYFCVPFISKSSYIEKPLKKENQWKGWNTFLTTLKNMYQFIQTQANTFVVERTEQAGEENTI